MVSETRRSLLRLCVWHVVCITAIASAADESDYYRIITITADSAATDSRDPHWKPAPDRVMLEVSGLETWGERLAVSTRQGNVWLLDGVYDDPPRNVAYHCFAAALHDPLGLLRDGEALLTVQRSELTRLRDSDRDDVADEYLAVAKGWDVSGNYHAYAYGPKRDGDGNLWITLNTALGKKGKQGPWRGWAVKITPDGKLVPICAGLRSPCGLGASAAGDMFATDQQGDWIATNSLVHLRRGAFFGHPAGLNSATLPDSPVRPIEQIPSGLAWPEALEKIESLRPPAAWFPYKKMGQSPTDIVCDLSEGRFGPFAGQLFVGEFRLACIHRVFLEKVDGEYQGACFPFRGGFASAVLRMAQGKDGSMFAGLTNRGWSSIGSASYGLQRVVWTGKTPFEIKEMRALPDGFELATTLPVERETARDVASYRMSSYTYRLHNVYGSDEIMTERPRITAAEVSSDGLTIRLTVDGLREGFVHELHSPGLRSAAGEALLHQDAYYTLNRIPPTRDQSN